MISGHPGEFQKIRAIAIVGGRKVTSRSAVEVGDESLPPGRTRRTIDLIRRQFKSYVATLMIRDPSTGSERVMIQVGGIQGAWDIRIDLVPNDGNNTVAIATARESFPPMRLRFGWHGAKFFLSADWRGNLPELPSGDEWHLRVRWKTLFRTPKEGRLIVS